MTSTRFYTAIFVVLMVSSTAQAMVEFSGVLEDAYLIGFVVIIALSSIKALLVAGYFQHLRHEPRSVSYLMAGALVVVLALTAGAAYSIL
jgi:cytochrome c oxidase subunit 4